MKNRYIGMAFALSVMLPLQAMAGKWPTGPVRWIVPYPPGGGNDGISRLIAHEIEQRTGASVVVDNKGGANGTIGINALRQAVPDGHTVSTVPSGPLDVNPTLNKTVPYDRDKDFSYVGSMIKFPLFLVASHRSGIKSVTQLVERARLHPDKLTYSSAGIGNSTHLAGALLGQLTGTRLLHVPYTGTGPAAVAVVSGEVDLTFGSGPSIMPMVQANKVRLLGVAESARLANMPDVPTVAEQGVPGFEAFSWAGVVAPAGIKADVLDDISRTIFEIVSDPAFQKKVYEYGMVPMPGTSQAFRAVVARDAEKWGRLIREAGITAQ
ncbi:MAG: tripartite tricarboxylate transporter substrate binding protein [Pigmentiphaga sp.]|uniref:Bug family tripartite tricarboxylate transporter substrate binding protein n=1 Tax=Pigmentiphaga sp. TaxID=1977564 RepID=UPI0029AA149A|nr:tripartite tricarboxylate transporter substrate binding protein [Pigmentiphaga sp.]MDX3905752.1 tripartite tricarboxylate transporter substrate binding protein [Pigmentiphaga sp.]